MAGYTKLFNSILASTIWLEDDKTRLVWITLLAMADKNGIAEGSVPGVAAFAHVSVPAARLAIKKLSEPDADSRSQEYEGRRIAAVDGGWRILNHGKYRSKLSADERREYQKLWQRQYRAERRQRLTSVTDVNDTLTELTQAEADTEAVRTPLPPSLSRGRVTRDGLKHAKQVRQSQGGCQHIPPCETYQGCLTRMAREIGA